MWFGGLPGKIIWQSFMSAVTLLFSWHRNTLNVSSSFRDAGTSDINKRTNNSCFCHFSDWQNMEVGVGSGETESWFKMFVETKYILTLCPWLMASLFGPLKEQNRRNCYFSHENRFDSWVCFRRWTCFSSQEHSTTCKCHNMLIRPQHKRCSVNCQRKETMK